jgi:hypothetical protein
VSLFIYYVQRIADVLAQVVSVYVSVSQIIRNGLQEVSEENTFQKLYEGLNSE